jgi:hypothetical protein
MPLIKAFIRVTEATAIAGRAHVVVEFHDEAGGTIKDDFEMTAATESERQQALRTRARLLEARALQSALPLDVEIDVTPPGVAPVPKADADRQAYFTLVMRRTSALAQGRPASEIDAIQADLDATFKPEYLP